jgi:DNA-binding GntR family transcriptional regulator
LGKAFGVSKTPVREALQRLRQEGLVRSIPSIGYEVVPLTLEDALELLEMRRVFELAAIERSIERITDEELDRLQELIGEAFLVSSEEDWLRWFNENTAFHAALAEPCGIHRLAQAVRDVMEQSFRLYFVGDGPFNTTIGTASHEQIIDALRRHDLKRARELIEGEVEYAIETTVADWGDSESNNSLAPKRAVGEGVRTDDIEPG